MEYFINTYIEPIFQKIDYFIENLIENNCMMSDDTLDNNSNNQNNIIINIKEDINKDKIPNNNIKEKEWDIIENDTMNNV